MLFGCCSVCSSTVVLLAFASVLAASPMKGSYEEGKEFSFSLVQAAMKEAQALSVDPDFVSGDFDEKKARQQLLNGESPENEVSSFVGSTEHLSNRQRSAIDENEDYFERSEEVTQNPIEALNHVVVEEGVTYEIEKCKQSGESFPQEVVRTLAVEVTHTPEVIEVKRRCQGHRFDHTYGKGKKAKKKYNELEANLSTDREVDWYGVSLKGRRVTADWRHYNNVSSCDLFNETRTVVQEEAWEESDHWQWAGLSESEAGSPDVNLVAQECIELEEAREVNGRSVYRKCWKDRLVFVVHPNPMNACLSLKGRRCSLLERKCLKETPHGCLLWENTYKCFKEGHSHLQSLDGDSVFGLGGEIDTLEEEPNTSFGHAAATLSLFSEIEKELESNGGNAQEARLFTPQVKKCKKAIGGDLILDCCQSMRGVANDLYLSKCNAEEKALAAMRRDGLCHYIGKKTNSTLGLKTSTTHVYACFGSKIARVLQEQARKQLGISWGSAKNPNLSPLSPEQIAQLDLSTMDLSELVEDQWNSIGTSFIERLQGLTVSRDSIELKMEES